MTIWVMLGERDIEGRYQFSGLLETDSNEDLGALYEEWNNLPPTPDGITELNEELEFTEWCKVVKGIDVREITTYEEMYV